MPPKNFSIAVILFPLSKEKPEYRSNQCISLAHVYVEINGI